MIDPATEAEIQRLFETEGWPIGTIGRQLKLHHSTVERIVCRPQESRPRQVRPTMIDPYRAFIDDTLKRWPDLKSRRLFDMCVDRGYPGAPDHFRSLVRRMYPERASTPEAFLQLRTHPGEQGQVDWGHFGYVSIGRSRRQLLAFVFTLSWSRMTFLRFFLGAAMPCFLQGHVEGFEFHGGVPRTLLYDNLKSAVLARKGDAKQFHPTMLALSKHYRFRPQPVGVRKGNEKGRVERAIRFVRDSFFGGRQWTDLRDLNRQAHDWSMVRAANRPWPQDKTRTVREAFEEERPRLLRMPGDAFPCDEIANVQIQKTPYARFDGNQYTVPHTQVMRTLSVVASETEVRILSGAEVVAVHDRCYDKGQVIEKEDHLAELRKQKRKAKQGRASDRLLHSAPNTAALLEALAERGENLGATSAHLLRLLDQFGGTRLNDAAQSALEQRMPHPRTVQMILEADEQRRNELPRIEVELPDDERVRGLAVKPHELAAYDTLRPSDGESSRALEGDSACGLHEDSGSEAGDEE